MRLPLAAVAVALVSLSGCAGMAQQQAREQAAKDRAACATSIPLKIGSYEKRANCVATAMISDLEPAFPNQAALIQEAAERRIAIGQEIDAGKITPEEGAAQMAEMAANLTHEAKEEDMERQQTAAANLDASAQMLNAAAAFSQASKPMYAPPPVYQIPQPIQTTCSQIGAFTNCTSQ